MFCILTNYLHYAYDRVFIMLNTFHSDRETLKLINAIKVLLQMQSGFLQLELILCINLLLRTRVVIVNRNHNRYCREQ
jgi:hypothetical protein